MVKLNVLLAVRQKASSTATQVWKDVVNKFKNDQGLFKGTRKFFYAAEELDDSTKEYFPDVITDVVSTPKEQIEYAAKTSAEYIQAELDIEATNASGTVNVPISIDGEEFIVSSLELMKLKDVLQKKLNILSSIKEIPTRDLKYVWEPTDENGKYISRERKEFKRTTVLNTVKIHDATQHHPAMFEQRKERITLGVFVEQDLTSAITLREKVDMINRLNTLLVLFEKKLQEANDVEVVPSQIKAKKILSYIYGEELQ